MVGCMAADRTAVTDYLERGCGILYYYCSLLRNHVFEVGSLVQHKEMGSWTRVYWLFEMGFVRHHPLRGLTAHSLDSSSVRNGSG